MAEKRIYMIGQRMTQAYLDIQSFTFLRYSVDNKNDFRFTMVSLMVSIYNGYRNNTIVANFYKGTFETIERVGRGLLSCD